MINKMFSSKRRTDKDFVPAYFKLQKKLLEEIETGQWDPGSSIPPERRLAEIHKVSIGTVKKAILNLVNEGYLYRKQGSGTFVAGTDLRRESLRYYRFLANFRGEEAKIKIKFLKLNEIDGLIPINQYLKIRKNQRLYELKRIFLSGKKPIIYTISYMPEKMFPKLNEFSKHKFEAVPIFISLEKNYGLPTIFNRELFGAVPADKEVASRLEIKEESPLLLIEMLAYTYQERPYEYRLSYCLSDMRKVYREW
jgi:GntR family transcriptional regulator